MNSTAGQGRAGQGRAGQGRAGGRAGRAKMYPHLTRRWVVRRQQNSEMFA